MGKFSRLIEQIEKFITKYYKNEMVKGGILFLSVFLVSYGLVTGLEYVGRFNSAVRLMMLLSFVGINLFLLVRFIIVPILKLNKVGKHLSLKEASVMIGGIFPEIGDKLMNTLALNDRRNDHSLNMELVQASIEQRSNQLSVIPFSTAIDLKENRKYLRFLLPILFTFITVAALNPNLFIDGSERIVNFNTEYVEPAPFKFVLASDEKAKEGEDYVLQVKLLGDEIPDEVTVFSNLGEYNLIKKSQVLFEYRFTNLVQDLEFHCEANGFKSERFIIENLKKPVVHEMYVEARYPKHTGKKNETFENTGDITVPEGTLLKWIISANNLEEMVVFFNDSIIRLNTTISNRYNFQNTFFDSQGYGIMLSSKDVKNADSLGYNVNVVKDKYPSIQIEETIDSTNSLKRFVEGKISDDYGFRGLVASLKMVGEDTSYTLEKPIKINRESSTQLFSFYIDLSVFDLGPGDRVEYTFTVTDNDEINGFKSTSSSRNVFKVPDLDELDNVLSDQSDKIKKDMDEALEDSKALKQKIKNMKSTLMNKESTDWKDRQSLDNLLDLQMELQKKVDNLKKDFDKNRNDNENFLEPDEEFLEKQEKLQELLDELMDEEMLELFKELQDLMDELNKEELLKNLENMDKEMESMNEKMDRTLELFKNMELDQKLENLEEQLRDLKKQQDELQEMTENGEKSSEELSEMQEDINKKFDEIQKDIEEVKEKNEALEKPRDLDFDKELEESLDQELDDSKESLDQGKEGKASKSQQGASEKMEQMANDIAAMQSQSQQQQQSEDMDALRYLLENVVALSHDQEALMGEYQVTQSSDPYYLELNREQLDIDKATDIVRDSLLALSKRVYQLSSFINDELAELNYNLEKSLLHGEERKTNQLNLYQQYAMTDYNDLALMLSEVLDQMQQQAQSMMPGSGSCSKPGGMGTGKGSPQMNMQQMKDAMKDQIGKMKGGNKPGDQDGQGAPGQTGDKMGGSIPGMSTKEQVKMAAQQSQIRESLKKLKEELNKDGSGFGNSLNDIIKDLDKMEDDLLNGNVGSNFIKRQEDILTRLLESEKAIRERGYSDERESNEGKNFEEGNLIKFTEYNRKKSAEVEFLRSMPLSLQVYYKTLVNEYFNSVNN